MHYTCVATCPKKNNNGEWYKNVILCAADRLLENSCKRISSNSYADSSVKNQSSNEDGILISYLCEHYIVMILANTCQSHESVTLHIPTNRQHVMYFIPYSFKA